MKFLIIYFIKTESMVELGTSGLIGSATSLVPKTMFSISFMMFLEIQNLGPQDQGGNLDMQKSTILVKSWKKILGAKLFRDSVTRQYNATKVFPLNVASAHGLYYALCALKDHTLSVMFLLQLYIQDHFTFGLLKKMLLRTILNLEIFIFFGLWRSSLAQQNMKQVYSGLFYDLIGSFCRKDARAYCIWCFMHELFQICMNNLKKRSVSSRLKGTLTHFRGDGFQINLEVITHY